jgi:SAM-dependent methyltransferase
MTGRKLSMLPEILAYPNWRHRVHLGNGLYTMGYNTIDNDWQFYGMPENVKGKSVLDVGANDGYYSFKAEEKGASAVTAMDIYWGDGSTMVGGWPLEGITLLKTYLKSNVVIRPSSVYNIEELQQQWDIVLCNDLLSWLDDIPRALDAMSSVCREKLVIHDTFSTSKKDDDIQVRKIGIANLHRMQVDYLKEQLRKRGFRNISVQQVFSFRHYAWQYENFLPAFSPMPVEIWDSPIEGQVIKTAEVNNTWVLQHFGDFVFLRELGWAKRSDLHIPSRKTSFWMRQLRKCIPDWVMAWRYSRNDLEPNCREIVLVAER